MATDTRRLLYDNTVTGVESAHALIFGRLAELAFPVLTAYHSDLFHDALWIRDTVTGELFTFFWSVDQSGTALSLDNTGMRENAYRVTVSCEHGTVAMTVESL